MSDIDGSHSSQAQGYPRIFFQKKPAMSRSLFQMGSLKGLSNPAYNHDPAADDVDPDIDYNNFEDDQTIRSNDDGLVPGAELDSGRGSHEETGHVNNRVSSAGSSRVSRSGLEIDENMSDYSSDEPVGHFKLGGTSSEESLTESNFEEGGRPLQQEENTLLVKDSSAIIT